MRAATTAVVASLVGLAAQRIAPLPVIDMHLHAMVADTQGPPPLAMCTPIPDWFSWDPAQPYRLTVLDAKQACPARSCHR